MSQFKRHGLRSQCIFGYKPESQHKASENTGARPVTTGRKAEIWDCKTIVNSGLPTISQLVGTGFCMFD